MSLRTAGEKILAFLAAVLEPLKFIDLLGKLRLYKLQRWLCNHIGLQKKLYSCARRSLVYTVQATKQCQGHNWNELATMKKGVKISVVKTFVFRKRLNGYTKRYNAFTFYHISLPYGFLVNTIF